MVLLDEPFAPVLAGRAAGRPRRPGLASRAADHPAVPDLLGGAARPCTTIVVLSVGLLAGWAGIWSVGHPALFAIGAYFAAYGSAPRLVARG